MKKTSSILFIFLISLAGCTSFSLKKDNLSEGSIDYSISYPGIDKGDMFAAMMLPTKMKLTFKGYKSQSELGTGAIFNTIITTDFETKSGFQLLKIVNKKYILKLDSSGIIENARKVFNNVIITPTEESKDIAGYLCKKAIVEANGKTFEIFYCPNIGNKYSNWFSPYSKIEGTLMEYNYKDYNIEMRFSATKVNSESIADEIFLEPE